MQKKSFADEIAERFAHVELEQEQMHAYQREGEEFLWLNPFSALFVDMGLGKCVMAGSVCHRLLSDLDFDDKILIIGPLKVATSTWPTELRLWRHLAIHDFEVLREEDDDPRLDQARKDAARKAKIDAIEFELPKDQTTKFVAFQMQKAETACRERIREEKARSRAQIHIISREQVEWLVYFWKGDWPYRTVIIDESSAFKDYASNRFKALAKTRNTEGLITRLHLLTATPATETYEHLFAQIYLLDRGKRLGKNITAYRTDYFSYDRYKMKWKLRPNGEKEITEKLADICLVMKQEDYLKRDKPNIQVRRVTLSEVQRGLYDQMATDFVVTLPDGKKIEAETAAALSAKLLQMASGSLYETYREEDYDTGELVKVKRIHDLHDEKIEMLREIVDELDGTPVLVAYHWQSSLAKLKKAFPKAKVMDREGKLVKEWNAKKIPVLLIHPQSGGHGLNMQKGGHNVVFFDLPWSLELFIQLIGRVDRQGQTMPVLVQLLITTNTVDELVWSCLQDKNFTQDEFFRLLRIEIRRRKKAALQLN